MRVLFALLLCCMSLSTAFAAERNIILFVADDLSPDISCYGNKALQTPNIDALAKEATLFTEAFATTASCSASRSVILTGLHNHANGQYGHLHNYHKFSSHPWVQSLPVLLKNRGYRTARIGKYHVGPDEVYAFDEQLDADERQPLEMVENCRELFTQQSEKPFFLLFATGDPHRGGGFADEIPTRPNRFGNPAPEKLHADHKETIYSADQVKVPPFLPDTPEARAELAQYYQSASRVDRGLGRLIEILKATACWENTLLVFTSDHGVAFAGAKTTVYEPGLRVPMIVRDPYQAKRAVRNNALVSLLDLTPTLLDFAGGLDQDSGEIVGSKLEKVEWHTYVGAEQEATFETGEMRELPYRFHGRSFLSILGQSEPQGWDRVTASHSFHELQMYYPMRVYRDRKYKLIWNVAYQLPYPFASDLWTSPTWQAQLQKGPQTRYGRCTIDAFIHRPQFELYNIEQDPWETKNLAQLDSHASVLAEYQQKLKQFQINTGDPWALKWNYD